MNWSAPRRAALLGLVLTAGCSFTTPLKYDPIVRGVEDPTTTVALTVVDARAPDLGGTDKTEIGRVRGGFGNPFPLYESDPQKVTEHVRAATEDALHHARVAVASDAERTLVATVTEFWIDGYMGYKALVKVFCELRDQQGNVLWTATISGSAGGVAWWTPTGFVAPTFQKAMADYTEHALVEFNTPGFQKHLF